jgi:hypothetical protein
MIVCVHEVMDNENSNIKSKTHLIYIRDSVRISLIDHIEQTFLVRFEYDLDMVW